MKFATQTLNDMQHEYMKVFKTELEKATNNRIKVEIYPASQLGGAQRQTEGLRLGTIDAAIGPVELFVGADPRYQVPALTGIYKSREHLRRVLDVPEFRKTIFDIGAARGMVGLSLNAYDMQSFVFKVPVSKVADFAGKRIRVLASEGEQSAVAALGGSSVPMSLPEVLPALQQGTIDGVNSVLGVFVTFRYYDAASIAWSLMRSFCGCRRTWSWAWPLPASAASRAAASAARRVRREVMVGVFIRGSLRGARDRDSGAARGGTGLRRT